MLIKYTQLLAKTDADKQKNKYFRNCKVQMYHIFAPLKQTWHPAFSKSGQIRLWYKFYRLFPGRECTWSVPILSILYF